MAFTFDRYQALPSVVLSPINMTTATSSPPTWSLNQT
jgi:hypothetical protein